MLSTPVGAVYLGNTKISELPILALAWTVADLQGRDVPGREELAIALAMRRGEQPGAVKRQVS